MVQQHKTCTKCGETKLLDGFYKSKNHKYGVSSWCKPCIAENNRRYREENRDKMAEYRRRYYEENREKVAENNRRYYEENREKRLEWARRYYEANREEEGEYRRLYQEKNHEIINSKVAKRQQEERELVKQLATVPLSEPWTPGEDALILADNGMTMYQKAVELGRTLASAQGRRQRLLAKGGVSNDRANA